MIKIIVHIRLMYTLIYSLIYSYFPTDFPPLFRSFISLTRHHRQRYHYRCYVLSESASNECRRVKDSNHL